MNRSILELVAPMKEGEALKKAMEVFPPYEDSIRYEESTTRLIALNDVYDLYIPNEMSVE